MLIWAIIIITFVSYTYREWRKSNGEDVGSSAWGCASFFFVCLAIYGWAFNSVGDSSGLYMLIFGILATSYSLWRFLFIRGDEEEIEEEPEQATLPITITISADDEEDATEDDALAQVELITPSSAKMSGIQFEEIISCADDIKNLIKRISGKKEIFDAVNENSQEVGGDVMPSHTYFAMVLKSIFMQDLERCYKEMGHRFTFGIQTGEGQALVLVTNILSDHINTDFRNYDKFCSFVRSGKEASFSSMQETYESLIDSGVNFSVEGEDEFGLSALLQTCGGEAEDLESYRILLYRLVSLIAKMDEKVTEKEKQWLERMLVINEMRPDGADRSYGSETPEVELEKLIGLKTVKEEVKALSNYITVQQKRKEMGLPVAEISYHCVFTGNPGTGKTTVARILAGIYRDKGILKRGHLVETDRSGLVAEYVGQTAVKTNRIIDKALDGVLFIDEAYSLIAKGEDFGLEAIATLLKRMEDDRDRLIVILAGYTDEMEDFINSNPGLRSRFNRYICFPDYSVDELTEIFQLYASKHEYRLSDEVKQAVRSKIGEAVADRPHDFGNGRYVRNLFERVVQSQANRLASDPNVTRDKLTEILAVDLA